MTPTIIVPLNLTFSEFLKATLYLAIRSKPIKIWFLFGIAIGTFSFLSDTVLSPEPVTNWYSPLFSFLFMPLFFICFFGIMGTILSRVLYKSNGKQFKNASYQFTHWGIDKTGNDVELSIPWRKVIKVKENKNFFFLFTSPNDAQIIQKKNFADDTQLSDFRRLLEDHSL